ncbi:MAG TPA: hypothetical protein PKK23_19290 [Nitrospirales bacterium]|nr:hypothetical protein [Nitrospiraceae bacterium]HNP31199.1 hypothetical protein [Nitrospirales bacterium]
MPELPVWAHMDFMIALAFGIPIGRTPSGPVGGYRVCFPVCVAHVSHGYFRATSARPNDSF